MGKKKTEMTDVDHAILYARMVGAAEAALEQMEHENYALARQTLISAMQTCEELYIRAGETEEER